MLEEIQPQAFNAASPQADPHFLGLKFLGVGVDDFDRRYLDIGAGEKTCLLSVEKLTRSPKDELAQLERLGLPIIDPAEQRKFLKQAHIEARQQKSFKVVIAIGLVDGVFYLPDGPVPPGMPGVKTYFDKRHEDVYRKFAWAGTWPGYLELVGLFKGNTRLIAGAALVFCGPVCAAFSLDPPGLQYFGTGGHGKTPAAKAVASLWGWDVASASGLGFGMSWKNTPAALELIAAGQNHTLIYLDEMANAPAAVLASLLTFFQGQGTARYTEQHRLSWREPMLSTSNTSVLSVLRRLGEGHDRAAYIDRLIDVPAPRGSDSFFEDLHGYPGKVQFCTQLCNLAERNHGLAARAFVLKFTRELATDRAGLSRYVAERRKYYTDMAYRHIRSRGRDLDRVDGRLATIYAAGRLACDYGVLPFDRKELLDALLTCERDHVDFIAETAAESPSDRISLARDKLGEYIASRKREFIDARRRNLRLPRDHDHDSCLGYYGLHEGRPEWWFSNRRFEEIAGGKIPANLLKAHFVENTTLATEQRGDKVNYVVKRQIPDIGRQYVVALRRRVRR
jgi:Domain of unknown function (DUF927)